MLSRVINYADDLQLYLVCFRSLVVCESMTIMNVMGGSQNLSFYSSKRRHAIDVYHEPSGHDATDIKTMLPQRFKLKTRFYTKFLLIL